MDYVKFRACRSQTINKTERKYDDHALYFIRNCRKKKRKTVKKEKNTCNWLNWSRVRAKRELRKYHVIIIFPPFSIRRVCVSTWRGKHVRETMWVFILIFLNYFWCFNGCIFILRALRYQVVDKRTEKIFKFTHNNSDEVSCGGSYVR